MSARVPRHRENLEAKSERRDVDALATQQCMGARRNRFMRRTVDRYAIVFGQRFDSAHMITMVVSAEDGRWCQGFALKPLENWRGIARIDDRNPAPIPALDQPDVVVLKSGDV